MNYKDLANQIKNNEIKNIYLFCGTEQYLAKHYLNQLKEKLIQNLAELNYSLLEEESISNSKIFEFCESLPVMSEKKLLVLKRFDLLNGKRSNADETSALTEYMLNMPSYIHIIFYEEDVNKKTGLYKFLQKNAMTIEFEQLSKEQMVNWIERFIKDNNKVISKAAAEYLVDILETDIQTIKNECLKLINFVGVQKEISIECINKVCQRTLKHQIFEMMDDIAAKNPKGAILKMTDMLKLKEPEVKILGLIIWNIRTLLKVRLALDEGLPPNIISKRFGIGFVNKYVEQCKRFTAEKLEKSIIKCSEADLEIKTSGMDNKTILEKLIVEISL